MKKEKGLRDVWIAGVILCLLILLAATNVLASNVLLGKLSDELESVGVGRVAEAEKLYQNFTRVAFFLSITVNHDDLEDAEELLVELRVAVRGDDADEVEIVKSRLKSALRQLGRLSGAGIDSII